MKYLMVILDGAVDYPLKELDGKTPLMAAAGDNMKAMARKARIGAVQPLPSEWAGDPEAALMSLFGYDPRGRFTGQGPLDAAAHEIDLDRADMAFRVNLIHTDGERLLEPTAGQFPKGAGRELMKHVQDVLRIRTVQFFPSSGYRHVMVWRDGPDGIRCTPPHAAQGEPLRAHFPTGDRAEQLTGMLWDSAEVLADHPINKRRRDEGKPTADMVWPWAPGRSPELESFSFRHGVGGACVAGNDAVKGLARLTGLRVLDVPGATGSLDTDYVMKARATLTALEEFNFCLVHIGSPNEAGLAGDWEAKLDALQRIDERFFGTLLDRLGLLDNFRILVVPDHPTYVGERKAAPGWVPFMLTGSLEKAQVRGILPFDERATEDAEWRIDNGWRLLDQLFEGETG
ncbi:MAG TPA: 2,3-bisphosphoglycerate-independent phosphoglycerate mutase [Armatimonadota bacterium]|nr:2,3-bisphosphoglycerate-independent phosphoglycerate mutase [Armatimonadota bacterium]